MVDICALRFTPAHAGNTASAWLPVSRARVHPRSRGEYERLLIWQHMPLGSPPLTRGIPVAILLVEAMIRFTPAHAGNTLISPSLPLPVKVHPRSRGEYCIIIDLNCLIVGSPPLTRGIQSGTEVKGARLGFTPAHAGNTLKKALFYLTFSNTHFHISFNF